MKRILVTGAAGQIGSELVPALRQKYRVNNVIATDIGNANKTLINSGPFELLDCLNIDAIRGLVKRYKIDSIFHLAALLSATAENNPQLAWHLNMNGLMNILEVARETGLKVFSPSSIGAFGNSTPQNKTPQVTIQRPNTIYGITKVAGELLCDYYFEKYGVDTRGIRYPGIISNVALPGGGTTDYAVHIFYEAIKHGEYTCYLDKDTWLDMIYMPDAVKAAIDLMEADSVKLNHRNAYNVSAYFFTPHILAQEIEKKIPGFKIHYKIDPVRQAIADSWPDCMDDSAARVDWGWNNDYGLSHMVDDMIKVLSRKIILGV